jgi:ABC-type iron transport system FetAB permease component
MPRPRPQDVLFGLLGLALGVLMAFDIRVVVLALLGAFACGAIYVFAGMMPDRTESFWHRIFISGFLSIVVSSLVLILPGTFGLRGPHPDLQKAVVVIAGLIPLAAIGFEVIRTPRVIQGILWCLGYR